MWPYVALRSCKVRLNLVSPMSRSIRAKSKKFSQFNIIIAGHSNVGKTSFIQTLIKTINPKLHFVDQSQTKLEFPDIEAPTALAATLEFQVAESAERIMLQLIDTPGIQVPVVKNSTRDYSSIINPYLESITSFIKSQYDATLLEEAKVKRNPKSPDYQIHVCLYFIDPSVVIAAKGLSEIDKIVLGKLSQILNVVPCLGKSDQLSLEKLAIAKKYVMDDIIKNSIHIQAFTSTVDDDDENEDEEANLNVAESLPFAIICGEELNNEFLLERVYPWGTASVENEEHCDFVKLKDLLFGNIQELKDITREVFYEKWRTNKLIEVRGTMNLKTAKAAEE